MSRNFRQPAHLDFCNTFRKKISVHKHLIPRLVKIYKLTFVSGHYQFIPEAKAPSSEDKYLFTPIKHGNLRNLFWFLKLALQMLVTNSIYTDSNTIWPFPKNHPLPDCLESQQVLNWHGCYCLVHCRNLSICISVVK
jgi:hypothetical protein